MYGITFHLGEGRTSMPYQGCPYWGKMYPFRASMPPFCEYCCNDDFIHPSGINSDSNFGNVKKRIVLNSLPLNLNKYHFC